MLGTMIKVALLLINSIAVLNEERFLARSKPFLPSFTRKLSRLQLVGCLHHSSRGTQILYIQDTTNPVTQLRRMLESRLDS